MRDGTARDIDLIWVSGEGKNFWTWGWTARIKKTVRPALRSAVLF